MMRRDFLEKNKIRYSEDYLYAEDMGLYKDILKHGGKLSMLPEPLLRYGIAKNRKKPEKYGQIQYDSSKKVQKEKLAPFGIYNSDDLNVNAPDEKCIYLRQLEKANKDKHILDQEVLEGVVNRQCPRNIRNAVIASRPGERQFWIERLGTREVSKFSDRFPGVVLKETDAKIMIQWKEWRCEVYRKTAKNEWLYESDCPKPKKGAAQ
jgi:hypothetical protein